MKSDKFISYDCDTNVTLPKINISRSNHPDEKILNKQDSIKFVEIFHVNEFPKQNKKALEKIAQYFRREFSYDVVPFDSYEDIKPKERYFIFGNTYNYSHGCVAIGGCCFRWRNWEDYPGLALQWIWLHPYHRDKGVLSAFWSGFRELYGDFVVEPPLSGAMKGFLKSKNECWKCGRICKCTE